MYPAFGWVVGDYTNASTALPAAPLWQKRLREHLAEASTGKGSDAFPLKPIGHLQSCFSQRNGTPRQPLLVPAARAQLTLRSARRRHDSSAATEAPQSWVLCHTFMPCACLERSRVQTVA